ncbi:MAG: serine/threonine protein phosphatase [Novosphingobium sp.]|nr:MAG: serine/threonine protein phosphatase [Novosphingobium sp.]
MLKSIRQFFARQTSQAAAAVPAGERVYAIGDVHGRLDLFETLAAAIEADDAARGLAETTVILLGDLIDRGPDSAGVVAATRDWQSRRKVRVICGNHEEKLLESFDDPAVLRGFLLYGGDATIQSYGVAPADLATADLAGTQALMRRAIPSEDLAFIAGFEDFVALGDYLFVHAGIRPGVPIGTQTVEDMRWIREPFLDYADSHGFMVVHGHTITAEPDLRRNRIGIDTGAYKSGRLTALGLEGERRWLIATEERDGAIVVDTRPV